MIVSFLAIVIALLLGLAVHYSAYTPKNFTGRVS